MQKPVIPTENATAGNGGPFPFGSNDVRLAPGEWLIAGTVLLALFCFAPAVWQGLDRFQPGPDYRVPYRLGYDYWMFDRWCGRACNRPGTLVVGDSVVWGHYVKTDGTLSHYLNELAGEGRFANLGVDGIHPASLSGLLEHYGRDVSDQHVLLHCNLLWMSSKRHDLQLTKEFAFNHPDLVPQILPKVPSLGERLSEWTAPGPGAIPQMLASLGRAMADLRPQVPRDIPCYKASARERLDVVAGRTVPFLRWKRHLQVAYFDDMDVPTWTLEHPYRNPLVRLPSPDEPPSPEPVAKPWTEQGIPPFNPPWVELETSLQWHYFQRAIRTLQDRGNRVFVLVGPFNEHMLTDASRQVYQERKQEAAAWLRENQIPHAVPPPLPSQLYADASHPLAEGYRMLAEQLLADESFVQFLNTR